MNHIQFFINQVEIKAGTRLIKKYGTPGIIPATAKFIVHRIAGLSKREIAKYFNCSPTFVYMTLKRQQGYLDVSDPLFTAVYNRLLSLYIRSTRIWVSINKLNNKIR